MGMWRWTGTNGTHLAVVCIKVWVAVSETHHRCVDTNLGKLFSLERKKNNNRFVPVTEKLTNKLAGQAFDYGSYIDPAMVLVHPKSRDHNSTRSCRLKIMTCPTEHGISFACSSHLDKKDILSKTDNEIALSKVCTILNAWIILIYNLNIYSELHFCSWN